MFSAIANDCSRAVREECDKSARTRRQRTTNMYRAIAIARNRVTIAPRAAQTRVIWRDLRSTSPRRNVQFRTCIPARVTFMWPRSSREEPVDDADYKRPDLGQLGLKPRHSARDVGARDTVALPASAASLHVQQQRLEPIDGVRVARLWGL